MENLEQKIEEETQKQISEKNEKVAKLINKAHDKFLKVSIPLKKQIADLRKLLEEERLDYVSKKRSICDKKTVSYHFMETMLFSYTKEERTTFSKEEMENSFDRAYDKGVEDTKRMFRLRGSKEALDVSSDVETRNLVENE